MPSKSKQCHTCNTNVGPRSDFFCDYHAGYAAGYSVRRMSEKRKSSPDYQAKEREEVKKRMLKLRAKRKKRGLTVNGLPLKNRRSSAACKKRWAEMPPEIRKNLMEKVTEARLNKPAISAPMPGERP